MVASVSKWARVMIQLSLLILLLAGCDRNQQSSRHPSLRSSTAVSGGTAVIALSSEPDGLNPLLFTSAASGFVTSEIHAGLTEMATSLVYQPRLASHWDIGADRRSVTYYLRPWSWEDGHPVTAYDVVQSYRLFVDPQIASPRRGRLAEVASVVALDSSTVRYTFVRPQAEPLARSWHHILPSHVLDSLDVAAVGSWPINNKPLSSGEFSLVSWEHNRSLVLARNPQYSGKAAYLSRVVFKILPEATTRLAALETGEVDLVYMVDPDAAQRLERSGRIKIARVGQRRFYYLLWNMENPLLADRATRRALSFALDRELMLSTLLKGYGGVANSPIPPALWNHHRGLPAIAYDPDRARSLLADVGWRDSDGDGVIERDGRPFTMEIITRQGDPIRENCAVILRAQLAAVGVRVSIRVMEQTASLARARAGNFDAFLGLMNANLFGNPAAYVSSAATDRYNYGHYASATVDSLLARATGILTRQEALPVWLRLQEELLADPPAAYLMYPDGLVAVSTRIQDAEPDLLSPVNNLASWWIDPADRKYRESR